ncbi:hypothetical protein ALCH109712_11510 [Alkalicoccus chagannorensis]
MPLKQKIGLITAGIIIVIIVLIPLLGNPLAP